MGGRGGTDQTPLFARIATAVFQALYEHKLTLVEALKILEFSGNEFRAALARGTKDEATRVTLEGLNALKPSDYQAQVGSTHNRFQRLLRNVSLRAAFGQTEVSLRTRWPCNLFLLTVADRQGTSYRMKDQVEP